jgi:ribosome-associated protein
MDIIKIDTEFIKLDQLLKFEGLVENGGEAKAIILKGMVKVNNEVEMRRGRKLYKGYIVEYKGKEYTVG